MENWNSRERFLAEMHFEKPDRPPLWLEGFWSGTLRRWYREGLQHEFTVPDEYQDGVTAPPEASKDVERHFPLDPKWRRVPVNLGPEPQFERKVVDRFGHYEVFQDTNGALKKKSTAKTDTSFFTVVKGAVETRDDWEQLKAERYSMELSRRFPENWSELVRSYIDRDYPLMVSSLGMWGPIRNLMGVDRLLYSFADNPDLIEDILSHLTELWIRILDRLLQDTDIDCIMFNEDICYKTGPLVSPEYISRFMKPNYRRITSFLADHGVDIILYETDGDCRPIIPVLLESGVTGLWPFECTNGQDILDVGREYPELQVFCGLDKRTLIRGDARAIRAELDRKVPSMLERRGYVPCLDHHVSQDISWESYRIYRSRLTELCMNS